MGYDAALEKAWQGIDKASVEKNLTQDFLADAYSIDIANRRVLSISCNAAAKTFTTIILLHYLVKKCAGLPALQNEWISFQDIPESIGYYPVFKARVLRPLARKYGVHPEALVENAKRFGAQTATQGDVGVVIHAFQGVPLLITLWRADDEFGPEANVLFDKSITSIFCVEDIVVLAEIVARAL